MSQTNQDKIQNKLRTKSLLVEMLAGKAVC